MGKKLLILGMVFCLVFTLIGCSNNSNGGNNTSGNNAAEEPKNEPAPKPETNPDAVAKGEVTVKEAPILANMVKSGSLPPVEERLPVLEDVMIEPVHEAIGEYGGEWRMPWKGIDDKWAIGKFTEEALFRFKQDGTGLERNVAKGYDVNENATEYTVYLRKGMKWSDGEPFTADDVLFYWEHMLIPETFGKSLYDAYFSVDPATGDRARAEVTKVDDYTVKITHKYPHVLFLERVAIDNKWFFAPAHFYKTILPEFIGEEAALAKAKEYGFEDLKSFGSWTGYYYWVWPERPTLRAWVANNDPHSERFVFERNPYYWKTDSEGQQLPYIDRIVMDRMQDNSHFLLETLAGNIDLRVMPFNDFTVIKENETKGDYRVLRWNNPQWASSVLQLNQTVADPKLRELFQDIRFREALSVAVNRIEVAEIVTDGLADPQQASVPEGVADYQEGWADQWAEYDVDRANQLLDEIGLPRSGDYRTFKDGSKLELIIYQRSSDSKSGPFEELLSKYFKEVGINTIIKIVDDALYQEMKYNNELTATTAESISLIKTSLRPDTVVPLRTLTPWYGMYGKYRESGGAEGVKPEGNVALIMEYWDKLVASTNMDDISHWSNEIIKLHQKNQWILGYSGPLPSLVVVKNNMKNVPDGLVYADEFRDLGHGRPMQFYFEQ